MMVYGHEKPKKLWSEFRSKGWRACLPERHTQVGSQADKVQYSYHWLTGPLRPKGYNNAIVI